MENINLDVSSIMIEEEGWKHEKLSIFDRAKFFMHASL